MDMLFEIFNYQVFPKMDIRNVVESTHQVTINNWCNFGEEECQHRFTVVPYRCLGKFKKPPTMQLF